MAVNTGIQPCGFLLELSLDWIVERASENADRFLSESHVTLINEPLARFVMADPLHDIRNLFSRLNDTAQTARAYRVRLVDDRPRFDLAFQQIGSRVLLEGVLSHEEGLGEAFGAVGGLAGGLAGERGQKLLDLAARRMRALTNFDRVTLLVGDAKATSSRSGVPFREGANASLSDDFPALVADASAAPVPIFPRDDDDAIAEAAILRALLADQKAELDERGFASTMRVPVLLAGEPIGEFRMAHTRPCRPSFEAHAAAELFAEMFAMRLEMTAD
jgi:light-regulated signal transduction histidine kinase (bacteriophytochrome)